MNDIHGLAGQRAIVVGGAGLIGSAVCGSFHRSGMEILAVDRDEDALRSLARRLPQAQTRKADITDPADRAELPGVFAAFGATHLVQSAGWRYLSGEQHHLDYPQWAAVVDANLVAPLYLTERFIASLKERGEVGTATFVGSVHARLVLGDPSYSAAKGGVDTAVRELARLSARAGIRVNAVSPGHVEVDRDGEPARSHPTILTEKSLPPESIAAAVHFLTCGHCSPHTTGANLTVDGGLSLVAPWIRD